MKKGITMIERMIKPIENNKEKMFTYRAMMVRHRIAMDYGFYLEALMIEYAMIEDRLIAFLYHSGAIANRNVKPKINSKKTKAIIRSMMEFCEESNNNINLGITNISGKIRVINSMIKAIFLDGFEIIGSKYYDVLKKVYLSKINAVEFMDVFSNLNVWCEKRNEITHAMLNKNVFDMKEKLLPLAEEGLAIARYIDARVDAIKKDNKIRKAANLAISK